MYMHSIVLAILFAFVVGDSHKPPSICMTAPIIPLKPGTLVSARLESPGGKRCEGALTFSNADFLPLRFILPSAKCPNPGTQLAEFTVPLEVPNGEAHILWRCADSPAPICTRAMISDGKSDAIGLNYIQSGNNSCVFAIETRTSFTTSTGLATTATLPIVETIFSTGTPAALTPAPNEGTATVSPNQGTITIPPVLVPTGSTTVFNIITDGSATITQSSVSLLFSTATAPIPTQFTVQVPFSTATITSVTGTVTNTFTTTLFSPSVSQRWPETNSATDVLATHTCSTPPAVTP